MKNLASYLLVFIISIITSCNTHTEYESKLITKSHSIKELPIPRNKLIEVFELEQKESEIRNANANEELTISSESKIKLKEFMKSVTRRDFFILEFDPILSFKSFSIINPKGNQIYSSSNQTK